MTYTYVGSSFWRLKFDSKKTIVLDEKEIREIVEASNKMFNTTCRTKDMVEHTQLNKKEQDGEQ